MRVNKTFEYQKYIYFIKIKKYSFLDKNLLQY